MEATPGREGRAERQGGSFLSSPQATSRHKPLSEFQNVDFFSVHNGRFGLLNKSRVWLILNTGFRGYG
jgi:hypothetical protein